MKVQAPRLRTCSLPSPLPSDRNSNSNSMGRAASAPGLLLLLLSVLRTPPTMATVGHAHPTIAHNHHVMAQAAPATAYNVSQSMLTFKGQERLPVNMASGPGHYGRDCSPDWVPPEGLEKSYWELVQRAVRAAKHHTQGIPLFRARPIMHIHLSHGGGRYICQQAHSNCEHTFGEYCTHPGDLPFNTPQVCAVMHVPV